MSIAALFDTVVVSIDRLVCRLIKQTNRTIPETVSLAILLQVVALCAQAAPVDHARLVSADESPGSWLTHGRTYREARESPLTQITTDNVDRLGLAWYFDTGTRRGLEASPLVIDGVIYSTGSWSKVYAHDAATGEPLWQYDPQVPKAWGVNACCDVVNRGVAAWGENVYVGTLDGRLVALNRRDGVVAWTTLTIDASRPYTITGAPRIIKGNVIIGNGGAESGVRGYVSAYDANTGELNWRFFTVPGNPDEPFESAVMSMAAKTWTGDLWWQVGGGGTVWDSMAYDPELNLLYIGVGNGAPWNRYVRSPGGGDNLFLSSIVALDSVTGEYVWHYQTTPGDSWDYTATQHMILADLEIDGVKRGVLMQAPKNGFFYVLDRATGELISAEKYTEVTWASHVDLSTGRPVETDNADHSAEARTTKPSPVGGHNWHPMAFNAKAGLVYIPAIEMPGVYSTTADFTYRPGRHWNLGQAEDGFGGGSPAVNEDLMKGIVKRVASGHLIAWNPVEQVEAWRVEHATPWNGGVLTTSTNLVFQGTGDGRLVAYRADTGERLWHTPTQTGVVAPPISYEIDGTQYVAVMVGWGGATALGIALPGAAPVGGGRMLVYKLDGVAQLPESTARLPLPEPPPRRGTAESVEKGGALYNEHCGRCHGAALLSGGLVADLRWLSPEKHDAFKAIVLDGALSGIGMVAFGDVLDAADVEAIQDYVLDGANTRWENDQSPEWWREAKAWFMDSAAAVAVFFLF